MALDKDLLISEIRKINDEEFKDFIGWGGSYVDYCYRWANCIKIYAEDIIPESLTLEESASAMASFLISAGNTFGRVFENSIMAFCQAMIPGMLPDFTGVMPPTLLLLSSVYQVGLNGGSAKEIAEQMAEIIHNWFLQGTAINVNTGVTIKWS